MNLEAQIDRLRERARDTDASRELIEFSDQLFLQSSDHSLQNHKSVLGACVRLEEAVGGLDNALYERDAAEDLVKYIHREYSNEETNRDYRNAIRIFGRELAPVYDDIPANSDGIPNSMAWISTTYSSNYDPKPTPRNMVRWEEEVQSMLAAAENPRDRAAIALAFDAGLRGGEIKALEWGDFTDHKHGLQVTVNGKRGQRTVTLIPSVPYVTQWRNEHPRSGDPDAPMWCKLGTGEEMSGTMKLRMLTNPADRTDIQKPVTFTNFRKSSAAHLASKGMNQAHLEDHHGWVRGSDAASRYISVFAEDADRELARVYGREVEEPDNNEIAPIECPRCGDETPREKSLCVWCGQALEPGAADRAEALDDLLVQQMATADPSDADELLDLRKRIHDDPEARARGVDQMQDST